MATATGWANRITRTGTIKAGQVTAHPDNWKIHPQEQQDALDTVLSEIGFVSGLIINESTGYLLNGHGLTLTALGQPGGEEIELPATWVDLSEVEEQRVLATFDNIMALAVTDKVKLAELLDMANPESSDRMADLLESVREMMVGIEIPMAPQPTGAAYVDLGMRQPMNPQTSTNGSGAEVDEDDADTPTAYTAYRVIQVMTLPDVHKRMLNLLQLLGEHWGTDTMTDTIVKAVEYAAEHVIGAAAEDARQPAGDGAEAGQGADAG